MHAHGVFARCGRARILLGAGRARRRCAGGAEPPARPARRIRGPRAAPGRTARGSRAGRLPESARPPSLRAGSARAASRRRRRWHRARSSRAAPRCPRARRRDCDPSLDALETRNRLGKLGQGLADHPLECGERRPVRPRESGDEPRKIARPQRDQGRIGHAHRRRAQPGESAPDDRSDRARSAPARSASITSRRW